MNRALVIVLATVVLEAMGVGLIMPVLPSLLRGLVQDDNIAVHFGVLLSLYALMQVLFAPLLGMLSDRFGRRPVLLASLAGAAIDYAIMAAAPVLWVLYVGRVIAGVTGATGSVAASCIADTTEKSERARRFGLMSACFGCGMIAGPMLGGLLAGISIHAPFAGAAALNGVAFLTAFFLLPETRRRKSAEAAPVRWNPWTAFGMGGMASAMTAMFGVYFVMQLVGQGPASLWVIFTEDRFHWDAASVGLSLAVFGALHALFQGFVTGPVTARLGEKRTLLLGMLADGTGFLLLAFATRVWLMLPILPLLALGGIGMPALQAMLSNRTTEDRQGALQGTLTSLTNLSSVIGPLAATAIYLATASSWNGWVWVVGAGLYLLCLPALRRREVVV